MKTEILYPHVVIEWLTTLIRTEILLNNINVKIWILVLWNNFMFYLQLMTLAGFAVLIQVSGTNVFAQRT